MTIDSKQYKEDLRHGYDNAAPGWQKWWKTIESATEGVSKRLVELAEIKPGSKVLDIATGIGEPALTAAKQVGKTGEILAIDISPQMLSFAKQRAISLGLQDMVEFKEGDAETIDLPSSTFDAALCRWGLMFFPNPKAGLSNIYRSLVKGGHFAAAVWATPDKVPFISVPMNIVLKETNSLPQGTLGPFSMSDQNNLKKFYEESGFTHHIIERINVVSDFDSTDDFTAFTIDHGGPSLQKILAAETNERREQILKAISKGSEKYADSTGKVRFDNEAILIVGKK
ncbi:MAG TPA: methyltransferase domain-containing protein [Nitrososphaeraceae archaeon]